MDWRDELPGTPHAGLDGGLDGGLDASTGDGSIQDANTDDAQRPDGSPSPDGNVDPSSCEAGYAPSLAGACVDIDECEQDNGGCDDDASCRNVAGGRACACPLGYEDQNGDGTACVSQCELAGCDANAECTVIDGEALCECRSPYVGSGMTCTFDAACELLGCDAHAECALTGDDTRECRCGSGYEGSGTSCANRNECEDEPPVCGANELCSDEEGTYRCTCAPGFEPDGDTCVEIDACDPDPCQHGGTCSDQLIGYSCNCAGTGYEGTDCDQNVDDCASIVCANGSCEDRVNGYMCICDAGFDGVLCDERVAIIRGPTPTLESLLAAGPYATANYTEGFRDGPDFAGATIYYPTDAEPPFAGVAIVPGFVSPRSSIASWGPFLASHGIVVMTVDPVSDEAQPPQRADALMDALQSLEAEHTRAGSPLLDKLADGFLGVMGWSMGGAATLIAARDNPALRCSIAMAPVAANTSFSTNTVPQLIFTASADFLGDPDVHGRFHYESLPAATPRVYFEASGSSHNVGNNPANEEHEVGASGLSWLRVHLEGDARYETFLQARPSNAGVYLTGGF